MRSPGRKSCFCFIAKRALENSAQQRVLCARRKWSTTREKKARNVPITARADDERRIRAGMIDLAAGGNGITRRILDSLRSAAGDGGHSLSPAGLVPGIVSGSTRATFSQAGRALAGSAPSIAGTH